MATSESLSRRAFLGMTAALPFAAASIAAAKKVPVGLELYSVRDDLAKDLLGTVTAVGKMGYEVVEFYSPYLNWTSEVAKDVRKRMDEVGLKCRSTHNNGPSFTDDGLKKAIELNQIIGSKYLIMASAPRATGIDAWKKVAEQLTSISEKLKPHKMATGYHNHQVEWRPLEGQRPMDVIAAGTPKDVVLQFDVGTCVEVGADPVAWINSNPGRIKSVHCKDWAAGRGYAVPFGEGDAPWKKIFDAAEKKGGVEYYLVEQETGATGPDGELGMVQRCLDNWKKLRA
jgi:sugar phosphate isomerase/epimerase